MFALGDYFDIPALRELAVIKFEARCASLWRPLELLNAIPMVFTGTPEAVRPLRVIVIRLIRDKLAACLSDEDIVARWRQVSCEVPDFVRECLLDYMNDPVRGHCHSCRNVQALQVMQSKCKACGQRPDSPDFV